MTKAKNLVHSFYQPIGELNFEASSQEMWDYSKERAVEHCDAMIKELQMLYKPEYTAFIINGGIPGICDRDIANGYDRISFYENLKAEIEKL